MEIQTRHGKAHIDEYGNINVLDVSGNDNNTIIHEELEQYMEIIKQAIHKREGRCPSCGHKLQWKTYY